MPGEFFLLNVGTVGLVSRTAVGRWEPKKSPKSY